MHLRLEATPEELAAKGQLLLEVLAKSFLDGDAPDLADQLLKSTQPEKNVELRYPYLREIHAQTARLYAQTLEAMVADIGHVLDLTPVHSLEYEHPRAPVQNPLEAPARAPDPDARARARVLEVLAAQGRRLGKSTTRLPVEDLIALALGDAA